MWGLCSATPVLYKQGKLLNPWESPLLPLTQVCRCRYEIFTPEINVPYLVFCLQLHMCWRALTWFDCLFWLLVSLAWSFLKLHWPSALPQMGQHLVMPDSVQDPGVTTLCLPGSLRKGVSVLLGFLIHRPFRILLG